MFALLNIQKRNRGTKIVNAHKLYNHFVDKLEKDNDTSRLTVYKEEVIQPVYNDCFKNGEYLHMVDSVLNKAPDNLTEIQSINEQIDEEKTNAAIKEALLKSSDLLPSKKETTVCVFPTESDNSAVMVTAGAGKIIVLYNKYYTDEKIRAGIAHEYHHSVWTEKHLQKDMSFTVLDNLIFEGKAVMFEKLVYPDLILTPVNPSYNKNYWSKVEEDLEKYDGKRSLEIIMGGKELPKLYGYSEGYKMVKTYLELHQDATPEEWTALSAEEIFTEGGYLKNYQ